MTRSIETTIDLGMDEAEVEVRRALGEEGFGVLTEIDVAATLAAKLGVQRAPLRILGACNPDLAHRALQADPTVSLLLPCNVVLEPAGTGTRVAAADPTDMLGTVAIAEEAGAKLRRVFERLGALASPG